MLHAVLRLGQACTFRGKATAATFENALSRSFGLDGGGKGDQEQPTDKGNLLQHVRARQGQEPLFRVAHYAGSVDYTYQGFVEKNEDSLYHDLVECLGCSEVPQVAAMFEGGADKSLGGAGAGGGGGKGGGGGGGGGGGSKKKPPSVSLQFKRQVNELMAALTKSKPHYVRCVKVKSNPRTANTHLVPLAILWFVFLSFQSYSFKPLFPCVCRLHSPTPRSKRECQTLTSCSIK